MFESISIFEPIELLSEAFRDVTVGVQGWNDCLGKLRKIRNQYEVKIRELQREDPKLQNNLRAAQEKAYKSVATSVKKTLDDKKYGIGKEKRWHFRKKIMEVIIMHFGN